MSIPSLIDLGILGKFHHCSGLLCTDSSHNELREANFVSLSRRHPRQNHPSLRTQSPTGFGQEDRSIAHRASNVSDPASKSCLPSGLCSAGMPVSSDSLPDEPLPFGADNNIHQNWRRSTSGRGLAREQDRHASRDYAGFVADTQALYGARSGACASIAPSSIHNVPTKLKRLLRRYPVLYWVLIGVFQLGVILVTIAIVLGAATAHARGAGSAKVAVVVLVIWGFALMIGSAAGGWTVWKGRKERARLERQWAVEEERKERRSIREKMKEENKRQEIKERERSLSRTRSQSRGRSLRGVQRRPALGSRPSFQEMTPAPSHHPDEDAMKTLPPTPTGPIPADALGIIGRIGAIQTPVEPHHEADQQDRESTWTHHLDLSDDDSDSEERAKALNDVLIRDNDVLMRDIVRTVSRASTPKVLHASPTIREATLGVFDSDSTTLESGPTAQDTTATLINSPPFDDPVARSPPRHLPVQRGARVSPTYYLDHTPVQSPQIRTSNNSGPDLDIIRSYNSGQGSNQSDENFMAGFNNPSDADSLNESARQIVRARSIAAIQRWDPDLDPNIKDAVDRYNEEALREEAGSEDGGGMRRVLSAGARRLTGITGFVARRRSRSVGAVEDREYRLERLRSRLRRSRGASPELGEGGQSWH